MIELSYELEAEAVFDTYRPRQTTLEDSVLAYVYTRLARKILTKDMQSFEAGLIKVKYPDAYITHLRRSLSLITEDLHQTRTFFKKENIRVTDKPVKVAESGIFYNYWINSKTGQTGSSSHVMRKEVKRYVQYYLTERAANE